VQRLRDGLPVRVHDGEELRNALDQIAEIALDGNLMADSRLPLDRLEFNDLTAYVHALEMKIERIKNIAEDGEPDEDWEGGSVSGEEIMAEREPVERCPKCGSEDICTHAQRSRFGCLDCDHNFDEPIGENEASELAGPTDADGITRV